MLFKTYGFLIISGGIEVKLILLVIALWKWPPEFDGWNIRFQILLLNLVYSLSIPPLKHDQASG